MYSSAYVWAKVLSNMEERLGAVTVSAWFDDAEVVELTDDQLILYSSSDFRREIIKKRCTEYIQDALKEIFNSDAKLVVFGDEELNAYKNRSAQPSTSMDFNPQFSFDSFIVGPSNRFAHGAAIAVTNHPGEVYNPLFLYGPAGVGKTHLLYAIANGIRKRKPDAKVVYIKGDEFTNELIAAIQSGKNIEFRSKYREADLFLIDDIQFLIGKESTQEEFFHTFNHLHTAGKQIIISSDRPPKDIETLEARLRTRFEWGLIADMSAPDYETRMAILQKKIELEHLEIYRIPDDVLQYIAQNVKNNIRELEGSLNKLIALYRLEGNGRPIDLNLAAEAMKDIFSPDDNKTVTPELIMDIVSDHFGVSIADLKSNKRPAEIAVPRQIVMYLCRKMTDVPLKSIGILLGGKNHSTIKHGVEKIEHDVEENEQLANTIDIIKKKINPV